MADPNDNPVKVLGLSQVMQNLRELSAQMQSNILRTASRAGAKVYLKDVKGQAYSTQRQRRTGLLVASMGTSVTKKGDLILGRVKSRPVNISTRGKVAAAVRRVRKIAVEKGVARNFSAFYWRFLEFGVATERKTSDGANRGSLSARPWVQPIFSGKADAALEAYRATVTRRLEEAARQLPKGSKSP